MNWLHGEETAACSRTAHTDSGATHGGPRRKKSPAKAKRDYERWVAYKNRVKSQSGTTDSIGAAAEETKLGVAGDALGISPPETVCTVNSSLNVCAADFTPREYAQVKPSTTQISAENKNSYAGENNDLHSDNEDKLCPEMMIIAKNTMDNDTQTVVIAKNTMDNDTQTVVIPKNTMDTQTDIDDTSSVNIMKDAVNNVDREVQVSDEPNSEVQQLRNHVRALKVKLKLAGEFHANVPIYDHRRVVEEYDNQVKELQENLGRLNTDLKKGEEENHSKSVEIAQLKSTVKRYEEQLNFNSVQHYSTNSRSS